MILIPRVLCRDRGGVVHIATQTYQSKADTLCGERQLLVVGSWAAHIEAPLVTCDRCLAAANPSRE